MPEMSPVALSRPVCVNSAHPVSGLARGCPFAVVSV